MQDLSDFIQQVKRANDIVDVVGSRIELRQRGSTYFARCPFHGEKTASFSVNRNLQIYKCFGCGESGDVIKFVQMFESCSFMEALEILAKRANLKMPETAAQKNDVVFAEKKKKRDIYFDICKETAIFYYKNFYSSQGALAREYMQKRGFDAETLKKFGIGFSPDRYALAKYLSSKKFSREDCINCGVLQKSQSGEYVDALSGRLIIPVFNMSGKVIAFGGRGLDERTIAFGKYKNTSETPMFVKKDNLFALNIVKEQKQQNIHGGLPNLVVVEGYMDVIAMYQAGFKRAVASMGTSLTENQAKLLSRLTDTVYICYDGDAAGQKATVRGMDILDTAGLEVKVMSVPENLDPDEYIKKYGSDAFEKLIEQALPLADYKLSLLRKKFPIDGVSKSVRNNNLPKFVMGVVTMLKQLADDERQTQYIAAVSLETGFSQEYFRRKLKEKPDEATAEVPAADSSETLAQYFVAASLLTGQPYAHCNEKPQCDTAFLADLYDYLWDCGKKGDKPSVDMLYTVCPDASQAEYDRIIGIDFSPARQDKNAEYFKECVKIIVTENLKKQREQLKAQYAKEPDNTELLAKIAELNNKINT
ncbi:MAG: DNA primase [Corallococcus sp.]|nr:DNA primase [Corallococcus sp.]MCM1359379.1 DNA primase [Corallococcus sp.]MCM1394822.1 DNA primase [Corallococcus sp.]